jgi:hypothetical protein
LLLVAAPPTKLAVSQHGGSRIRPTVSPSQRVEAIRARTSASRRHLVCWFQKRYAAPESTCYTRPGGQGQLYATTQASPAPLCSGDRDAVRACTLAFLGFNAMHRRAKQTRPLPVLSTTSRLAAGYREGQWKGGWRKRTWNLREAAGLTNFVIRHFVISCRLSIVNFRHAPRCGIWNAAAIIITAERSERKQCDGKADISRAEAELDSQARPDACIPAAIPSFPTVQRRNP